MKTLWKISMWIIIGLLSLFCLSLIVVVIFSFYRPPIEKADAIIILGAAINTPALHNRSIEGLRLYKEGKADVLVLSGGKIYDPDISEAQYMQKVIKQNSSSTVPEILDQDSHSTYENIKDSRNKLGPGKSVIIVSDSFHLARGVLMAKREGFHKVYWSSPDPSYYKKSELVYYYFREAVAMIAYIPKFIKG